MRLDPRAFDAHRRAVLALAPVAVRTAPTVVHFGVRQGEVIPLPVRVRAQLLATRVIDHADAVRQANVAGAAAEADGAVVGRVARLVQVILGSVRPVAVSAGSVREEEDEYQNEQREGGGF